MTKRTRKNQKWHCRPRSESLFWQRMAVSEKALLKEFQIDCHGSVRLMAEKLKIGRTTLIEKLKQHGLFEPAQLRGKHVWKDYASH